MFLGAIADDVTGGTDLASVLRRAGLTVVQTLDTLAIPSGADAVVVSMKTRTVAAGRGEVQRGAGGRGAARGGRRADLLQVLLDLRLDRRRQHRTGDRRAVRPAGRQLHDRLPGVSGAEAHGLRRASLRRRPAPLRFVDAPPSADADDRCEPGAGAGPADARTGRAGRTGHRRGGAARGRRAGSPSSHARRLSGRHCRCLVSIAISTSSPRPARDFGWSPAARPSAGPSRA